MATVTPINRPRGQTRSGVAAVLSYVMQRHKAEYNGRYLVTGVNCQVETCCTEFISTKLQYRKCDGKMYFHFVQSFHPEEDITPEEAHAVALELAQQWKDYEVIVATHTDAAHIHSHLVINSVSFQNGKKLHFEKEDLTHIRAVSDALCRQHGLSVCQKTEHPTSGIRQAEYHTAMRGESWKVNLSIVIDECMRYAVNKGQFIELMESEGYQVRWTDSRANITYITPDGNRCRDYRLHNKKYLKENMEDEFKLRAKEYAAYDGRNTGYAEDGAAAQHGQSRKHSESNYADGRKLDGAYHGGGDDRTVGSEAAGERQSPAYGRADGGNAQGTATVSAGRTQRSSSRDEANRGGAEQEQYGILAANAEVCNGESERFISGADAGAKGVRETGWESQREILFRTLRDDGFDKTVCESDTLADVSAEHHPGAVGAYAASALAGISILLDEDDDLEAKESAQNLGAVLGLAAGAALAVEHHHKIKEADAPEEAAPVWEQSMG